jgi:hypothetical protein
MSPIDAVGQKNGKICLPLGITTKSDFVFAQPKPGADSRDRKLMHCEMISRSPRRFEVCIKFACGSDQENLPDR